MAGHLCHRLAIYRKVFPFDKLASLTLHKHQIYTCHTCNIIPFVIQLRETTKALISDSDALDHGFQKSVIISGQEK